MASQQFPHASPVRVHFFSLQMQKSLQIKPHELISRWEPPVTEPAEDLESNITTHHSQEGKRIHPTPSNSYQSVPFQSDEWSSQRFCGISLIEWRLEIVHLPKWLACLRFKQQNQLLHDCNLRSLRFMNKRMFAVTQELH